jgi:hypothetical protein
MGQPRVLAVGAVDAEMGLGAVWVAVVQLLALQP